MRLTGFLMELSRKQGHRSYSNLQLSLKQLLASNESSGLAFQKSNVKMLQEYYYSIVMNNPIK
jgi:hypothetical protein